MTIRHILKDGTVLDDISGHVVKMEDAPVAYELMDRVKERKDRHGNHSQQK